MKKQKRPFFLVLFVLILFGVVAFMNRDQTPAGAPPTPDAAPPQTDKKEVGDQVKMQMQDDKKKMPQPARKGGMMSGLGRNTPSILKIHSPVQKPKPQESSTSTQWYTPQTGKS